MKRLGRFVATAWSMTASDEVLVASTAFSSVTMSSSFFQSSTFCGRALGDRLDHELAAGEVVQVECRVEPAADFVGRRLLHLALLDRSRELLFDLPDRLVEAVLVDLAEDDLIPGLGGDLGNPMPHQPPAGDSNFLDIHTLGRYGIS